MDKEKYQKIFYGGGVKFNKNDHYIHKNPHDFEEDKRPEKLSEIEEDIIEEEPEKESVKKIEPNITKE